MSRTCGAKGHIGAGGASVSGLNWCLFTRGSHMSTWKYGYQLDAPFEWLFAQRRQSAQARGKVEGLNSAQFTPNGISSYFKEGWTAEDA